ncbi:hypothetical protein QYF36_025929 [Acer negundo]|nr:hypothetical protein QYF36_025929 [Acer negundo]
MLPTSMSKGRSSSSNSRANPMFPKYLRRIIKSAICKSFTLRYHLSKISHSFKIYLVLEFLAVTTSQCMTLFQTTGYTRIITFINGGDFAVVGIILCLHAATKICHRAQNIASKLAKFQVLYPSPGVDPFKQDDLL